MVPKKISYETLRDLASRYGLSIVSVLQPVDLATHAAPLKQWQDRGYAGEMNFMMRSPDLLTQPARLLPDLASAIVVGVHYDRTRREPLPIGHGRVARYAWGRDYHKVLRKRLRRFVDGVESCLGAGVSARVFSDSVPLLERAMAEKSGMGFIGKNTMLIVPRLGSYLFLAEVLLNVCIEEVSKPIGSSIQSRCGPCTSCISECPTGAIVEERRLDARRCISYLTIEKRTALAEDERRMLGEWLFGCDICQDVCPFNGQSLRKEMAPDLEEFSFRSGAGQSLSLVDVLSIRDHNTFVARFAGTAIMRTKREGLLRNAAVVAGNTQNIEVFGHLEDVVRADPSELVRQHALWGMYEIARADGNAAIKCFKRIADESRNDISSQVRSEANMLLTRLS